MPPIEFLINLNKKLKTGNMRSIHLNALPGRYATRLDFEKLNLVKNNLAEEFINTIFQKSKFSFKISFDNINLNDLIDDEQNELNFITKKLNGMFYQNNDNYLEHGIKTFGFGYPLLFKRNRADNNKIRVLTS